MTDRAWNQVMRMRITMGRESSTAFLSGEGLERGGAAHHRFVNRNSEENDSKSRRIRNDELFIVQVHRQRSRILL